MEIIIFILIFVLGYFLGLLTMFFLLKAKKNKKDQLEKKLPEYANSLEIKNLQDINCKFCGKVVNTNSKYCGHCGGIIENSRTVE